MGHAKSALLPARRGSTDLSYENIFRVLIIQFGRVVVRRALRQKACVHSAPRWPDHSVDTYNLFYRDDLERTCWSRCGGKER
jgi:hypothetical protein